MSGYTIALFTHLVSLLLAVAGASLASFVALRLRAATSADEATHWLVLNAKVVRVFPVASLGLLASGAYMTESLWGWSEPWVIASLTGLGTLVVLGAGIEASRARALKWELQAAGLSGRARRLLRDPVAWSARLATLTLLVAVVFIMTDKPRAGACAIILASALIAGVVAAVPFWLSPSSARQATAPEVSR